MQIQKTAGPDLDAIRRAGPLSFMTGGSYLTRCLASWNMSK